MVFCKKCRKESSQDANFCEYCGENLEVIATNQKTAPTSSENINWPSHEKAGFGIRFVAYLIDGIVIAIIGSIITFPFIPTYIPSVTFNYSASVDLFDMSSIITSLLGILYFVYFEGKRGATPGKMATKLKVVGTDGIMPIGYGGAFIRYIGKMISGIVLALGYLWIIFDKDKQGWHDKIANTYVIRE